MKNISKLFVGKFSSEEKHCLLPTTLLECLSDKGGENKTIIFLRLQQQLELQFLCSSVRLDHNSLDCSIMNL